jgi:hypothetical protein
MKKVLLVLVIAMLMFLVCSLTAFAAGPRANAGAAAPVYDVGNDATAVDNDVGGVVATPSEFVRWDVLATYTGCLIMTLAFTQFFKRIWPATWPTQVLSYIIALLILLAANWALGNLNPESAGLCVFNAVIVTLAANGGYNNFNEGKTAIKTINVTNIGAGTTPPENST